MDRDLWLAVQDVLNRALDLPESERLAFLEEACASDPRLRGEVDSLLEAHLTDPGFLEVPIGDLSRLETPDEVATDPPIRIGPHEVIRPLGEGGMGKVFLAKQETDAFSRFVAIKVVKRGMDTDEVLRRFGLERRILASLVHPNIAQLYDAGATSDGRPYFVMEFVDGDRIDRYAERLALPIPDRLRLFQTACGAVQYAHQNLIVHRDIKPGNVLVNAEGVLKLVDFGIGTLLDESSASATELTRTVARRLTPDYASPEQLRGEPVTTAADVYALGVLLFELLTGTRPWSGEETAPEAQLERRTTSPRRPSEVVAAATGEDERERLQRARAIRGDLDTIVLKAMHPEPERRYSSAAALSDDIQRYLDGHPVHARRDSLGYRASKFVRRNRWSVATAAAVAVGLLGVTVTTMVQSTRVTRERDKAREVQSFLLETFGASTAEGASGDSTTVRQLLDGQAGIVRTTYSADPELQAEMLTVLADAYERLGLFEEAESLAREGLEMRRAMWSAPHPDIALSTNLLGWIRHQRGASEEAVTLLTESVDQWRRLGAGEIPGLARALNDLGSVHDQLGNMDEAEPLLREALTLRRTTAGPLDRAVAVTSSNLATLMYRRGDYVAADSLGQAAVEALTASVGPDHQRTFVAQSNLATFRWVAGDLDGAAAVYEDLLARQRELGGGRNRRTAAAIVIYASLLRAQNKVDEAERLLVEALQIQDEVLDPGHRDIGNTARVLGIVLLQTGRAAESLPYLERALAVNRAAYGESHRQVAEAMVGLARAHEELGDVAQARGEYEDGIAILMETLGSGHPRTVEERLRLGAMLLDMGDPAAATLHFDLAHRGVLGRPAPTPLDLHATRLWLAEARLDAGEVVQADSLLLVSESDSDAPEAHWARIEHLRRRIEQSRR